MRRHWVVEIGPSTSGCVGSAELCAALQHAEIPHTAVRRVPFTHTLLEIGADREVQVDAPVFSYGSVGLKRACEARGWTGAYLEVPGSQEQLRIWGEHMLNAQASVQPISEIRPPEQPIFIRPDDADKLFAGQVVRPEEFDQWRGELLSCEWSDVTPQTLVVVSPVRPITAEWRVIVAGGQVVNASQYRWDGVFSPAAGAPEEVLRYAQARADEWTAGPAAYAIDIARIQRGPEGLRVVELGAFSGCGLYQLDLNAVVRGIDAALSAEDNRNTAEPEQEVTA